MEPQPTYDPTIRLRAVEAGVIPENWGPKRTMNPSQARMLAEVLMKAADEAEALGAKDWMTDPFYVELNKGA